MADKTLLVTRPQGDERAIIELMHQRGYRAVHEPLTRIVLDHTQQLPLAQALMNDPDALILTSRHGANALAMLTELRDLFVWCVGDATAQVALSHGFERVNAGGGTVQKLVETLLQCYDGEARFLYISGEHVRIDLPDALATYGMEVERLVAYSAESTSELSETLTEQLRRNYIDGVTLMSPRAAQIWQALLAKAGVMEAAMHCTHFCLSQTVAENLDKLKAASVVTAEEPTLASLMKCIDNTFGVMA